MSKSTSPARQKRALRQIAHHLNPVITVAEKGISERLQGETERALTDHELIKVRISIDDRSARKTLGNELAEACQAQIVQVIGKIFVLYRPNPDANPKLSNIARFGGH
jgi:RNA-binding protein